MLSRDMGHTTTVIAAFMLVCSSAWADILVSNLSQSADYQVPIGAFEGYDVNDNKTLGVSFTTSSSSWTVDSLDLYLGKLDGTSDLNVSLWQVTSGGAIDFASGLVATFTRSDGAAYSTTSMETYNFTSLTSNIVLDANTAYFITATNNAGATSTLYWDMTYASSTIGVGSLTSGNYSGYMQDYTNSESYWDVAQQSNYMFAVNGSIVPEPATYAAFMGLGALGMLMFRRRKQA